MGSNTLIHYHFLIYRREQLWLPVGLWGVFCLIAFLFRNEAGLLEMVGGFMGAVLPLTAGVLASSALVGDSALELQFAAPRAPWRTLLERLGLLLGVIVVVALSYQVVLAALGVDISAFGNIAVRQLVWLTPSLMLMGLSTVFALIAAQGNVGALLVGGVWIAEVLLRSWFLTDPWARYVFLFTAFMAPDSADYLANQVSLVGLAVVFTVISSLLLRREERYI